MPLGELNLAAPPTLLISPEKLHTYACVPAIVSELFDKFPVVPTIDMMVTPAGTPVPETVIPTASVPEPGLDEESDPLVMVAEEGDV